jgi:MYXO-CTERM domain-containing protein
VSGGRQIEHTNEQAVVVGTCDPARACTGEEEPPPPLAGAVASGAPRCSNGNYCVPKPLPPLPPLWSSAPPTGSARDDGNEPGTAPTTPPGTRRGGCGCRLGPADTPLPAWSAGLVLVVALLARRRP